MKALRHIAVIDIGKTNAKLALVDLPNLTEVAVLTRPNTVQTDGPWPHFDVEGHWAFLLDALNRFHKEHRIDAISVTTHGACAALLTGDGQLAAPILDYEHMYSAETVADYAVLKPDFPETGSPTLAGGLNVGAQLHWMFAQDPSLRERTAQIVTYPQYWGHRLTGTTATDVTSLGCHTDLWVPRAARFSDLPAQLGIADKIAPVRKPTDILGTIRPEISGQTGLPLDTQVSVGIHDSNASLYPHLLTQEGAFSVVSTGTWVVTMSVGGKDVALDPQRDTLMNVDARGDPVPSARFMGGREYELAQRGHETLPSGEDVMRVLDAGIRLLPAVEPQTGPFAGQNMRWTPTEPEVGSGARSAAVSFYLALMTDTCLRLTGARGPTIVEGPFARNAEFVAMLAATTGRDVLTSEAATGTSIGAALLFEREAKLAKPVPARSAYDPAKLQRYAALWRSEATG
ncbi:FGGY-family carbohydrate kinase [Sulfitobacter sp. S190]|uniref:FGGY-family carbohydrate kinase n=1 Tax=Sulfitobacter sp. S190 TaxID=2867022 RepID=UPI0021A85E1D|nr:FGGY-family carbohydrate kinase [Sulfitobacter sp. S190]UWR21806.1 FGGY-family carbohydrate kinase [Sulfitobacter sp. S190]